jgi:DNA-binding transcriptional ArsR family regulator
MPSVEQLLADVDAYISIIERLHKIKGKDCDLGHYQKFHTLLGDPVSMKERAVSHLRWMWDEHLSSEWERVLPVLQDSVAAYQSSDFSSMSNEDFLLRVSGRNQLPLHFNNWLPTIKEIIVVPSTHIGPYLMTVDITDDVVRLISHARTPEGATITSPSLTRSELLLQLSALSNETRLCILELLNQKGELNANEIENKLELTQSATSRHLQQLFASGYLHQRRLEGVKHYRLNREKIANTADALVSFVKSPQ